LKEDSMETVSSRRTFLKRSALLAGGVVGVAGVDSVFSDAATAAKLDASGVMQYPPGLAFGYPSEWFVRSDLLPTVIDPQHLIISNRDLPQLPTADGSPNMSYVPRDTVMIDISTTRLIPEQDTGPAIPLEEGIHWSDFGSGVHDDTPHLGRRFYAWYAGGGGWSVAISVLIGDEAEPGWERVAAVVGSLHQP
jgi:hypothetical protein